MWDAPPRFRCLQVGLQLLLLALVGFSREERRASSSWWMGGGGGGDGGAANMPLRARAVSLFRQTSGRWLLRCNFRAATFFFLIMILISRHWCFLLVLFFPVVLYCTYDLSVSKRGDGFRTERNLKTTAFWFSHTGLCAIFLYFFSIYFLSMVVSHNLVAVGVFF